MHVYTIKRCSKLSLCTFELKFECYAYVPQRRDGEYAAWFNSLKARKEPGVNVPVLFVGTQHRLPDSLVQGGPDYTGASMQPGAHRLQPGM